MNESYSTHNFQKQPNFFPSAEACIEADKKQINTNPRYKYFTQTHFTAGDEDQFEQYRIGSDQNSEDNIIDIEPKVEIKLDIWPKYENLDNLTVLNTFRYIFNKLKKGIFIKIVNNKLDVFLPFSKKNFVNEWSKYIHIDPKYKNIYGFIEHIQKLDKRPYNPNYINKFIDTWYANNCLLRYEFPIAEGDTGNTNICDMFLELCKHRKLPNLEFFVNRRDFPILKKDGTEPYEDICGKVDLVSHKYDKYSPILSMVSHNEYADIAIPTAEDWARVCREEGKYFSKSCNRSFTIIPVEWENRKPIALFRGSSTGCGVTIETNPRLKLAYLSKTSLPDKDGLPFLDAGITSWNLRPRKIKGEKYLKTIEVDKLPFELVSFMSPQDQAKYKYLINVDGHVSAFRLGLELSSGACILKVDSDYKMWFHDFLEPFIHFIPVKKDLSDLIERIKWCKKNDAKCKEIAQNAKKFAKNFLSKEGILDYLESLLFKIKNVTGNYFYNNYVKEFRTMNELKYLSLEEKQNKILYRIGKISSYENLQAISICQKNIEFDRVLFENRNSKLNLVQLKSKTNSCKLVQKITESLVHEAFIGKFIMNDLRKYVPNVVYTFDYIDNNLYLEYIQGENLLSYLKSSQFDINTFLNILIQLSLTLHVAQKLYGFVHYDLTPWNIVLYKLDKEIESRYPINGNTYTIKTDVIPVIIDFGRSHGIYKNIHYGIINPYSFSSIQDILTILVTSLYEIIEYSSLTPSNEKKLNIVIKLANFISNTKYREKKFTNYKETQYFLNAAKKYSELISRPKFDLEEKTPLDLVKYIMREININFLKIESKVYYTELNVLCEHALIYAYISNKKELLKSYLKTFKLITKEKLKELYLEAIETFAEYDTIKKLLTKKYEAALASQTQSFEEKTGKCEAEIITIPNIKILNFDESIFDYPDKIDRLLKSVDMSNEELNLISYKYYKYVLEIDLVNPSFAIANIITLREIKSFLKL